MIRRVVQDAALRRAFRTGNYCCVENNDCSYGSIVVHNNNNDDDKYVHVGVRM
jgi:hypothetical protein